MEVSVLQWNVWYQENIHHVAEFLKGHVADVICLQELTIDAPQQREKNTPAYIAGQLGLHYFCKELPIESTDGQKMMLANGIFSRFPITESRAVWINEPKTGGGYNDEYRAYVEVDMDVEGKSFTAATTHMSYTHRFEGTPNKARETAKLVEQLHRHKTGFMFTGDLNAVPESDTIQSIGEVLHPTGPDYDQKTWTTKPFSYKGFEETELNWRLDYGFVTPDVKVVGAEILKTNYSDHLPLFFKVSL